MASGAGAGNDDSSNQILLAALAVLFALLAVALVIVRQTLTKFAQEKEVELQVKL